MIVMDTMLDVLVNVTLIVIAVVIQGYVVVMEIIPVQVNVLMTFHILNVTENVLLIPIVTVIIMVVIVMR